MRTISYELQGKEVPSALVGKIVKIRVPDNYKEAESLTKGGEADVVAKFADGIVIAIQGALRTKSKKATLEQLQAFADQYVYTVRAEGSGVGGKPKTAAGVAKSKSASAGNRLFEKCAQDETFLQRMVKQQIVDLAEFNEWQDARKRAVAEAAAPKPTATASK